MKAIADLLLAHTIPGVRLSEIRSTCAEAVSRTIGIPVARKQITYDEGRLSIAVPPVVKSALVLKQEELKQTLRACGISVTEIR